MKISKLLEDLSNRLQGGSDDSEVPMAISDLKAIADMANKLAEHLMEEQPQELEGWVQSKITKAADYIDAVYKNHVYSDHDCGCGSAVRGNGLNEDEIPFTEEVSAGLKAWRSKQKPGAIMDPATFKAIARKSGKEVAGAAYWKAAKAKYNASKK